ncbi:MAG: alpha-glucosidase/alpha-galactosidase, partial [Halobacteriaceae archaeon]
MATIALVGAGSRAFATTLVGDILSFDALADSTIALMDIDAGRLEKTEEAADILVEKADSDATVLATTDRREALAGADYVVTTINVGGLEPFENEIR